MQSICYVRLNFCDFHFKNNFVISTLVHMYDVDIDCNFKCACDLASTTA